MAGAVDEVRGRIDEIEATYLSDETAASDRPVDEPRA
jgi:hypothetical protein